MSAFTWTDIAAMILREIRNTYSNGRKPDDEITQTWARTLERSRSVYPANVWREAVTVWAVSHSDPPSPHDVITAARQVVGQWEGDPQMREKLNEFRRQRLAARMSGRLKSGRDYGAQEALQQDHASSPELDQRVLNQIEARAHHTTSKETA